MVVDIFRRFRPFKRQVDDFSRRLNGFQRSQGGFEHRGLPGAVAGLAKRPPKRVFNGGDARYAHRGSQVRHGGQADGGKASRFEFALYQSNGPAANRSGRDEHHHVCHVFLQVADHCWNSFLQQSLRVENVAHGGIMPFAHAPDATAGFHLL